MKLTAISSFAIITLISSAHCAAGQKANVKEYALKNGLCSESILLDDSGFFFRERGCEGDSYISYGSYVTDVHHFISFRFLPIRKLKPMKKIVLLRALKDGDSIVTVTFYDRYGERLRGNKMLLADTGNKIHEVATDGKGRLTINHFIYGDLLVPQFLSIYGEISGIPISSHSLNIYLNLPGLFLEYSNPTQDKTQKLNLLLRRHSLYDSGSKKTGVYKLIGK